MKWRSCFRRRRRFLSSLICCDRSLRSATLCCLPTFRAARMCKALFERERFLRRLLAFIYRFYFLFLKGSGPETAQWVPTKLIEIGVYRNDYNCPHFVIISSKVLHFANYLWRTFLLPHAKGTIKSSNFDKTAKSRLINVFQQIHWSLQAGILYRAGYFITHFKWK